MAGTQVTDPELLAQLNGPAGAGSRVTDPALLAELNATPSFGEKAARQVGLTARAAITGVTSLPAMIADLPSRIYNAGAGAINMVAGRPVVEDRATVPSEALQRNLTRIGLPEPENGTERVVQDITNGMAGAGGMVKAGQKAAELTTPLARKFGELISGNAGAQVISGATSGGAAGATREAGGGPVAQMIAGAAGGFVPAIPAAAKMAVRGGVRGGEAGRQNVEDTIQTFEDAGAGTPTVGQATQGRTPRALESTLAKTPGGAGVIVNKAEQEAAGMGGKVEEIATAISPRSGAAPAGRQIKSGIENFVDEFKGKSGALYDELDKHIPAQARVDISSTRDTLAKLNASIPGAPATSEFFKNSKIKGIEGAIKADTETTAGVQSNLPAWEKQLLEQVPEVERTVMLNGLIDGKLPYEAVKKLRTLVGNEISNSTIASDVPRSKWKSLYAGLSKDLGAVARDAGPEAERAMVRANNFHRSGIQRIEDVLHPILGKGDPEDIFKAALSGTQEGATTLQGVMKSLPEESRKVVAATALRRMGKATAGKQDAEGEVFSAETFLTNWNKMHGDAKRVLLAPMPEGMRSDLNQVAKVAANLREGSKVFANPSGTAQALSSQHTVGAGLLSLVLGRPDAALGIAAVALGANASARLMTNPKFVKFLSENTRTPVEQLPTQLNALSQLTWNMSRDDRAEVQDFVRKAREASQTGLAGGR